VVRFETQNVWDLQQADILKTKVEHYNAGKKNQGGAAFNLMDQQYEQNSRGSQLK
jgi:hypothetical protein